jgi:hypothetical protein
MTRTPLSETRRVFVASRGRPGRWGAAVGVLLLAAYLVFCHGCHADVDNELCPPGSPISRQQE